MKGVPELYSTLLFVAAACIAILLGFSPKFGALIQTIPVPVLGGLSIVVFGLIAATAGRIWVENRVDFSDPRNLITVAVALVLGAGNFKLTLGGFTLDGIGTRDLRRPSSSTTSSTPAPPLMPASRAGREAWRTREARILLSPSAARGSRERFAGEVEGGERPAQQPASFGVRSTSRPKRGRT